MIKIPYENILQKIQEKANVSKEDIEVKVKQKMEQLSGLISKEGAAHIVANEYGVRLFDQLGGRLEIKNILTGMRNVETVGKVQRLFGVREFETNNRKGKVGSMIIGDETGKIRVVMWGSTADNILNLKENDIIKLDGGYVKENQGYKEVHLNDNSSLIINPEGENVGEVKQYSGTRKQISELKEEERDIELLGTIVQALEPRFFEVCSECGKRLKQRENLFFCDTHNEQKPSYSYVMNTVLDDGTDSIRTVFFRAQAERLLGKRPEEMLALKENPQAFEGLKNDLLGKMIKVVGRTKRNQMFDRLEFVSQLVFTDVNPDQEIKKLDSEIKKIQQS